MVQWLTVRASNAGGIGSIPGRGSRSPHAARGSKKKKKEKKKKKPCCKQEDSTPDIREA